MLDYLIYLEISGNYNFYTGFRNGLAQLTKIININTDFKCNRSLNSLKFNKMYDFQSQSWDQMLDGLGKEILQRNSQLN